MLPIFSYRFSRWPWTKTIADRLDSAQSHMVSLLNPVCPKPGETEQNFFTRRRLIAGRLATSSGRWSHYWAQAICKWQRHVLRGHDPKSWSLPVYKHHGAAWLAERRLENSHGQISRTGTRCIRAKVAKRFEESLTEAREIPAPRPLLQEVLSRFEGGRPE